MNPQLIAANTAALQALAAAITGQTQAIIAQNASARSSAPAAGAGGRSTGGQAWDMVVGKFAALLGPLALLGQVIQAPIAGFEVLAKSAKLLASVFAPVFLPATILLSTAMVALSEVLTSVLEPGFESFANIILGIGIPAIITFIDLVLEAADTLDLWAKKLGVGGPNGKKPTEVGLDVVEQFFNTLAPMVGTLGREAAEGIVESGALGDIGSPRGRGADIVMRALRDVMGSLRNSLGPKAQISNLEGIGKSVQLAALNGDPIEKRMYDNQRQFFIKVERFINAMMNERSRIYDPPGTGDYEGETGTVGSAGGDI